MDMTLPPNIGIKATQLNEKAMLVKLTMRRAHMSSRDQAAEEIVQNQLNDASLVVNRKLFRDKANPVNRILTAASEVYTAHKKMTLPYMDAGPRILANGMYMEYTKAMKERIAHLEGMIEQTLASWDQHVAADISFRSRSSSGGRATVEDYPTAEQFRERVGFDLRFSPLPDESHFLFDLSEEDKAGFASSMKEIAAGARRDCIMRMLAPVDHLISKLRLPIGETGSIFRDSAITNVVEGCEIARKLNIDDDPQITAVIGELNRAIAKINDAKDAVRESQPTREAAAKKLAELQAKLAPFMGGM
jgi:hypothetical protein